jgi:hypothetical protein
LEPVVEAKSKVSPARGTASKREKFVALAERRTVNAIRSIRVIGKLGNPFAYEYSDQDVKKIVAALNKEIEDLRLKMARKDAKATVDFKL